jgi:hypothetical protein
MAGGRQMLQQPVEQVVDEGLADFVVVVEGEEETAVTLPQSGQVLTQTGGEALHRRQVRRIQRQARLPSCAVVKLLQSQQQVSEETADVIVLLIQRKPGDRQPRLPRPASGQRGLAITGRGGDEG